MGKLTGLLAKVEELPGKHKRAALVDRLKVFEQKLGVAVSALTLARESEVFVAEVFPDKCPEGKVPGVGDSTMKAVKNARSLRKKLGEQIEFIANTRADELLTNIVDSATGARDAVTREWKKRAEGQVGALRPLAKLAKEAGLAGADAIVVRLQMLEKLPVPSSPALAKQARSEFNAVATDVTKLELGGAAWDFLGRVVQGRAHPKDLENAEVRAFLDKHRLWNRLTVKLG